MRWVETLGVREGNYVTRYPWREIAESGKVAALVQGEDFEGDLMKPINAAYMWGRYNGYRVKTVKDTRAGEVRIFFYRFLDELNRSGEPWRKAFPYSAGPHPPTWIEVWVASGGSWRRLTRARDRHYAAKWAQKNGFCLVEDDGMYALKSKTKARNPFGFGQEKR